MSDKEYLDTCKLIRQALESDDIEYFLIGCGYVAYADTAYVKKTLARYYVNTNELLIEPFEITNPNYYGTRIAFLDLLKD